MIKIEVDTIEYKVPAAETIIQSLFRTGLEIPRFCYHEKLSIAGNCRMCLVELVYPKSLKPVASCALICTDKMRIFTNTALVKKARESVLEFLLANHPLDCPICDQGGECDLQDETMLFGGDRGRFYENKRSVEDKECGPLIKTVMTRCIHCTRCIRFCSEIAGEDLLGTVGRGSHMEVGTYIENILDSEISGNIIDLCPVGALTSKPYSFTGRPWELRSIITSDILDSFGSSIRVDIRGSNIMRILPVMSVYFNDEWISDKTRFFYDGLKNQRIFFPMLKSYNFYISLSWEKMFLLLVRVISFYFNFKNNFFSINKKFKFNLVAIIGNLVDSETIITLKDFFNQLGASSFFLFSEKCVKSFDFHTNFLSKTFFQKFDLISKKADICLLLNLNLRLEFPLLNIRMRRAFLDNNLIVLSTGIFSNMNYFYFHLSNKLFGFKDIVEGRNLFCRRILLSKFFLIFINIDLINRVDFSSIYKMEEYFIKYLNVSNKLNVEFNYVTTISSKVSAFEIGLYSKQYFNDINDELFYFCIGGEVFINLLKGKSKKNIFVYQGHNGDNLALSSDFVFPSTAFLEKNGIYLTFEGFLNRTKFVISSKGIARDDWQILVSFYLILKKEFKIFNNNNNYLLKNEIIAIRERLYDISPLFQYGMTVQKFVFKNMSSSNFFFVKNVIFTERIFNFYMTDSITKSSEIMALCTQRFVLNKNNFFK